MLEFWIANLETNEARFDVPSSLGDWTFGRADFYDGQLPKLRQGQVAETYYASQPAISLTSRDADFQSACDEVIDICLVLTFLKARCITPTKPTAGSINFIGSLGDDFIRARAIAGFDELTPTSLRDFFASWKTHTYARFQQRQLRLQLTHWLSGLTCYSCEDLYLSAGVQMDLVKQRERVATSNLGLTFFQGMQSASTRYGLTQLGQDYKNMRNDIVHEGMLSGRNFVGKTKSDCVAVIASTMNWIDEYILAVLDAPCGIIGRPRWKAADLEQYLPALTVR